MGVEQTQTLASGVHSLKIEMEEYKAVETNIEITKKNTLFDYKLQSIDPVGIDIKSEPDKTMIFIDNVQKGESNKGVFLYQDKHTLKLTKSGYLPVEKEIEIKEGQAEVNIPLKRDIGFLSIATELSDCYVYVNKEKQGSYNNIELVPGKYKIEIKKMATLIRKII